MLGWRQIDWRAAEASVRRLRQRIFTASKAGDLKKVRRLQKLMLRSRANTLVSVRRVTERNAGRLTAGVDGEVVLTPEAKMRLAERIQHGAEPFKALPVRRVYIPKRGSSTKRRPLGIPVVADRVHQARVLNALEPEWEARFEPRSYGFRPGRGCHDAIQAIYEVVKGTSPRRQWVLDADLAGAFDRIAHDHILAMLGTFPARGMVAQWLKAGVVEQGRLSRTEEGTPQGGDRQPCAAERRPARDGAGRRSPLLHDRRQCRSDSDGLPGCDQVRRRSRRALPFPAGSARGQGAARRWLAPRGLAFNEDKTRVVTLDEGFDFLGFNVRRYGGKPLIKPSKAAVRRIRERLRTELRSLRGTNARAVIKGSTRSSGAGPPTTGHRSPARYSARWITTCGSSPTSGPPSATRTSRHAGSLPGTSASSIRPGRTGGCSATAKAAPTCTSSPGPTSSDTRSSKARRPPTTPPWPNTGPSDGARRPCRSTTPASGSTEPRTVAARSAGTRSCPTIDRPQTPREWEHWLATTRKTINSRHRADGTPDEAEPRLIHAHCHHGSGPALLPAHEPSGLA